MAINESSFKIQIKTEADTTGAVKTSDALGKVSASAKDAGEKLSIGLNPDAFNKMGEAAHDSKGKVEAHGDTMKEGAHHAELFGEAHHTAHAAVKAFGEALPGVGQLAREMYSGQTLAIGMLALALEKLSEHFKEVADEQEAFLKSAASGVGSMLLAQAGAAASAAEEHQKLADSLAHAATGENSLLTAMSNRIALFDNYIAGLKKVEAAEDAAEEARIKRAQREGKITPEQAEAGMAAIHGRAESRNAAHDDESAAFKLFQETAALEKAQKDLPALAKAKEAADAKVKAAEAAQKSAATRAGEGKGSEAEQLYGEGGTREKPAAGSLQAKVNEAETALATARSIQSGSAGIGLSAAGQVGVALHLTPSEAEAQTKFDDLKRQQEQLEKAEESAKREATRKAAAAQAAKDAATEADRQYNDANKIVTEFGGREGRVSMDAAKLQQDREARAEADRIKKQSDAEGAAADAAFQDPLEFEAAAMRQHAQGILEQSRNIPPGSHAAHAEIQELTALVRELTAELAKFTHAGIPDHQGLAAEVGYLKTEVANLISTQMARGPGY